MQPETVASNLLEYGLLGIIVIVMGYYIIKVQKDFKKGRKEESDLHKNERAEWKAQSQQNFDKIVEVTERNTNVVAELKTTLLSIERIALKR